MRVSLLRCSDVSCGQNPLLPRRNIDGRFTSISRHTIARSNRAVLQAIIDGEDHAFREPVLVRAVTVRTPRHKRVPAVDLIAGRQLRREPSESNPRTCRARPHMGGQLAPPFVPPRRSQRLDSPESGDCRNRLLAMIGQHFKPISLVFSIV